MKIQYTSKQGKSVTPASDIPVDTVFSGRTRGMNESRVFLRAYGVIIDLDNPGATWRVPEEGRPVEWGELQIRDYQELEAEVVILREK